MNQATLPFEQPTPYQSRQITEMVLPAASELEAHIVLPVIAHLSHNDQQRWLTWVGPFCLSRQACESFQIHWQSLLQIFPRHHNSNVELICRALKSGKSHTVAGYIQQPLNQQEMLMLEQAAEAGQSQALLIRYR